MKYKITVLLACISMMLVGCGTIGGTVAGAGEDLTKAGEWIKNRQVIYEEVVNCSNDFCFDCMFEY